MIAPGLASLPFGIGFGVAATQKGLTALEATLMSVTVMAGTAQMVALDVWAQPLPLIALAVSVFVAKLRYFVMGAALQPHLPHLSPRRFSSWSGHSSFAESAMWHPGRWRSPPHSLPNGRSAAIGTSSLAPPRAGSTARGAMSANPETLIAIFVMALAAMAAKGGAFVAGAIVGVITTRTLDGFTPSLFSSVGAVALGRWLGLS
jgi:hypothetical protein